MIYQPSCQGVTFVSPSPPVGGTRCRIQTSVIFKTKGSSSRVKYQVQELREAKKSIYCQPIQKEVKKPTQRGHVPNPISQQFDHRKVSILAISSPQAAAAPKNEKAVKAFMLKKVQEASHPRECLEPSSPKEIPSQGMFGTILTQGSHESCISGQSSVAWMGTCHLHYHGLLIEDRNWTKAPEMGPIPFNS